MKRKRLSITLDGILLIAGIGLILGARLHNLNYNTLFLDEAINAVVGEDLLQGIFVRGGVRFLFGSYLYPAFAGVLSAIGGVTALRAGSAVSTSVAALFVYLATRTLFQSKAALFAMLLFGLTGAAISVGQLAVYDTLALPLLALALFLIVRAVRSPAQGRLLLLASSMAMAGAILAKYLGVLYLPVVLMAGFFLYLAQGENIRRAGQMLLLYWLLPVIIVLIAYGIYYFDDLLEVVGQQGYAPAARSAVAQVIVSEIGVGILLAAAGYGLLLICLGRNRECAPDRLRLFLDGRVGQARKVLLLTAALAMLILFLLSLAGPLYHLWGANIRSLWKNVLFSLIFLAMPAGYALSRFLAMACNLRWPAMRSLALAGLALLALLFFCDSWQTNLGRQNSWPNTEGVVSFLREDGLDEGSRVVAEAMDVFEYYFDFGAGDRLIWSSIWYAYYQPPVEQGAEPVTIKGPEAVELGIRGRYFDYVIIDDYYAPGTRQQLAPMLFESGYQVTYSEEQTFPGGARLLLEVYEPKR